MVGVTGEVNFWPSENLSGRVHFEGYSPEWRVLSKLSVQPWGKIRNPSDGLLVKLTTSAFVLVAHTTAKSVILRRREDRNGGEMKKNEILVQSVQS